MARYITYLRHVDKKKRLVLYSNMKSKRYRERLTDIFNVSKNPSGVDFPAMINILILHSQSSNTMLQMMAITWIQVSFLCFSNFFSRNIAFFSITW